LKHIRAILIILFLCVPLKGVDAQQRPFGAGIIMGEPTGVSVKLWTSPSRAVDFGLGWSIGGDRINMSEGVYNGKSRIHFNFDYLLHVFKFFEKSGQLPLYYGIGGRFNTGGGYVNSLAVRFVMGLVWIPKESQIDLFFEFVPSLQLSTKSELGIDTGLGARYYF
jgi:hypothetical protein